MNLILVVIIACEIGFWVFVILGLLARYVLRRPGFGVVLLTMTLVVDLVLLIAVCISLQSGESATIFHGLAALYLGVSIVYGHKMITWADARFAHHFAHGAAPVKLYKGEYAKEAWKDVIRTTLAVGIAAGILWLLTTIVDDPHRTNALTNVYPILGIWWTIDLLWAISYTLWPKSQPATPKESTEPLGLKSPERQR